MQNKNGGLTTKQALQALEQFGENKLTGQSGQSVASMFFSQFKDLMIIILAVATVVSVLMGEGAEAITIIAIVLLNASLGFLQEYKTEKTLQALKQLSAANARVIRDGAPVSIAAKDVVPNDLLVFEAGDKIAADCIATSAVRLACDEAMLTGESVPVTKHEGDKLFMGCIVTSGKGEAYVSATAMNTEMGKIAHLVNDVHEAPTPLQLKLKQLGRFVAVACIIVCLAVGFLGYLQGNEFLEMLLTGISLAVAAIPEGLPAIVTITLALSVGRILKKGAVIRHLHAVETLGCAGVICTDKTGTITQNKMTVKEIYMLEGAFEVTGEGHCATGSLVQNGRYVSANTAALASLFNCACLCTSAQITKAGANFNVLGDATEVAVLIAAAKAGYLANNVLKSFKVISENPFDSKRKMMSVIVKGKKGNTLYCKGAPDVLLEKCTHINVNSVTRLITKNDRQILSHILLTMAESAMRVLGFAESSTPEKGEDGLIFLGFMAMIDPPRPEVKHAVRRCKSAGIKPVMITGDHEQTALAIAKQVGIYRAGDLVFNGAMLDKMPDDELVRVVMRACVFARVSPAHKLRIVHAYKQAGQVVAMTGDGVNDAPAVKEADIGIAMGISGTDVTKEASGVVILDDNFATIILAVEEGRVIYQNIKRFIRFLLTSNLGEVLGMLFGMILGLPVSLLPIHILLVNLLTDGLPAIALGMEPPSKDIMRRRPRPKNEGLFAHGLMRVIILRGIMLGASSTAAYWACLTLGAPLQTARSACFLTIVLSQMIHIFEIRGEGIHFGKNIWLLLSVLMSALCAVAFCYLPIAQKTFKTDCVTGVYLVIVLGFSVAAPIIMSLLRFLKRKIFKNTSAPFS